MECWKKKNSENVKENSARSDGEIGMQVKEGGRSLDSGKERKKQVLCDLPKAPR